MLSRLSVSPAILLSSPDQASHRQFCPNSGSNSPRMPAPCLPTPPVLRLHSFLPSTPNQTVPEQASGTVDRAEVPPDNRVTHARCVP